MVRGRPSGRGGVALRGRRGALGPRRVSLGEVLSIKQAFQDPDEEFDVALDDPAINRVEVACEKKNVGDLESTQAKDKGKSGLINPNLVAGEAAKEKAQEERGANLPLSSSKKWSDAVEEKSPNLGASAVARSEPQGDLESTKKDDLVKLKSTGKKSWANVVGNRDAGNGMELDFIPPNPDGDVEFTSEDLDEEAELWKNALVDTIPGAKPLFKEMVGFVHRAWSRYEIPRIHLLKLEVFLFNFQTEKAKMDILARYWTVKDSPLLLKEWSSEFNHEEPKNSRAPVWIKLPCLNIQLWTKKGLSKIASALGVPMSTDGLTDKRGMLNYARILVEIDLNVPVKQHLRCKLPDGSFYKQQLLYEVQYLGA